LGTTDLRLSEEAEWVGQFEFLEWTGDKHLRHSKFIALREDKSAHDVKSE
jgi:ATP-dependent DNA ligase